MWRQLSWEVFGKFLGSVSHFGWEVRMLWPDMGGVFKQEILDKYLEKNTNIVKELLHMISYELTLAQDRIGVLGKMNANERMAKFILNISNQRARIGWQDNPVSLPMTRQDIADYLGLTLETVSREITKLKTSNIIKVMNSKQFFISNKNELALICK